MNAQWSSSLFLTTSFMDDYIDGIKIAIGPEAKKTVMDTLNADVGFLSKIHNMGYSLILGVHNLGTV